jgi:hypothetical protein
LISAPPGDGVKAVKPDAADAAAPLSSHYQHTPDSARMRRRLKGTGMPRENIFSGGDAAKIVRGMVDIITGRVKPPKDERAREARRLGLTYVIKYASPGVSDAITTLASRRRAIDGLLGRLLQTGDRVQRYSVESMFPSTSKAIGPRHRANLARFYLLNIPAISFDDLDALLKPLGATATISATSCAMPSTMRRRETGAVR